MARSRRGWGVVAVVALCIPVAGFGVWAAINSLKEEPALLPESSGPIVSSDNNKKTDQKNSYDSGYATAAAAKLGQLQPPPANTQPARVARGIDGYTGGISGTAPSGDISFGASHTSGIDLTPVPPPPRDDFSLTPSFTNK